VSAVFEPCPLDRYVSWVAQYARSVGKITHVSKNPFDRREVLIALRSFTTDGECGAFSREVLVPAGITHRGEVGHNLLYFEDRRRRPVPPYPRIVRVYSNPEFRAVPGYEEAVSKDAEQKRHWEAEREARRPHYHSDISRYAEQPREPRRPVYRVNSDEPVTVYRGENDSVVLLPRTMPATLTPEEAETLAFRILAAAGRDKEEQ
jgi:hypothetical protein